jgi:hypothetical protein
MRLVRPICRQNRALAPDTLASQPGMLTLDEDSGDEVEGQPDRLNRGLGCVGLNQG